MALLLASMAASPAYAHKLKVFATATGRTIDGQVYFVGAGPAPGATVIIETTGGAPLATLHADGEGRFAFIAATHADHVIRVDTGDGHSARAVIAADELPADSPAMDEGANVPTVPAPNAAVAPAPPSPATDLENAVGRAVAHQLKPLREQLNAYEDELRLRDLLGGLGYIFGLAGIVLWLRARREPREKRS